MRRENIKKCKKWLQQNWIIIGHDEYKLTPHNQSMIINLIMIFNQPISTLNFSLSYVHFLHSSANVTTRRRVDIARLSQHKKESYRTAGCQPLLWYILNFAIRRSRKKWTHTWMKKKIELIDNQFLIIQLIQSTYMITTFTWCFTLRLCINKCCYSQSLNPRDLDTKLLNVLAGYTVWLNAMHASVCRERWSCCSIGGTTHILH